MGSLSSSSTLQLIGSSETAIDDELFDPASLKTRVDDWVRAGPRRSSALTTGQPADAPSGAAAQAVRSLTQVLSFPSLIARHGLSTTLHPLQEWEGYVIHIGETDFTARLLDLTAGASVEEEEATIPLDEIADDDRKRMRAGSIFRWVIGYERSPAGTKKRVSQIVFRDLPAVTQSDLRAGQAWAHDVVRALKL